MIKFFRHIRKDLMEQNKTTNYLKYAIGEIILVVIGILIALSINNWNVDRLQKVKAESYIESIKNDLISDMENIDKLIGYGKNQTKEMNTFRSYIAKGKPNILKALDSSLNLNIPFYRYFPVNQTFIDMQSSGNSALLSETQRKALIDLSYVQNRLVIANEKIIQMALTEISARNQYITKRNDFQNIFKVIANQETYSKALLHQINLLDEMEGLAYLMNRFGIMIKNKSNDAIDALNKD
jgi:Family of unknown function (DUF6090)